MKLSLKVLATCITATTILGFASAAKAESAAGSAAFSVNGNGMITGVAMSAAVGADALSVAINTTYGNSTYALGSGDTIAAPDWERPADNETPAAGGEVNSSRGIVAIKIYDGEPEVELDDYSMMAPQI